MINFQNEYCWILLESQVDTWAWKYSRKYLILIRYDVLIPIKIFPIDVEFGLHASCY